MLRRDALLLMVGVASAVGLVVTLGSGCAEPRAAPDAAELARESSTEAATLSAKPTESTENVAALETPADAFLSGSCRGPDGASFEDLWIEIYSYAQDGDTPVLARETLRSDLDAHGSYRIGPVPPGEYGVKLRLPADEPFPDFMGPARELGSVTLHAGENAGHDFDLREKYPGRLRVNVTRAGAPAAGLTACVADIPAVPAEVPVRGVWMGSTKPAVPSARPAAPHAGALDARGEIVLGPLFPGEYLVWVDVAGASVLAPEVALVPPDGEGTLTFDAQTFEGTLKLLDAETGAPLANYPISIAPIGPRSVMRMPGLEVKTDENGVASIALAPGAHVVSDGSDPLAAQILSLYAQVYSELQLEVPIAWGESGAMPPEVRFPTIASVGEAYWRIREGLDEEPR